MYTTCLFCHAGLGANEVIEAFPVGRRLAFDAAKGRLWVVCRGCERWNLTPIEERWEAIEDCERRFGEARLRLSTDNIGLARLREGLELVRVGAPQRPEMAAWRYGDQFGRRRRATYVRGALAATAIGAVAVGASTFGVSVGAFWALGHGAFNRAVHGGDEDVIARIPWIGRQPLEVRRKHLVESALLRDASDDGAVSLSLAHEHGNVVLTGDSALAAARLLLPHANRRGGNRRDVQDAVGMIERIGEAEVAVRQLATTDMKHADKDRLLGLGFVRRLALEMALHEEQERRALAGELAALARMWKEAEEIAGIADGMFVGDGILARLDRLRRGVRE